MRNLLILFLAFSVSACVFSYEPLYPPGSKTPPDSPEVGFVDFHTPMPDLFHVQRYRFVNAIEEIGLEDVQTASRREYLESQSNRLFVEVSLKSQHSDDFACGTLQWVALIIPCRDQLDLSFNFRAYHQTDLLFERTYQTTQTLWWSIFTVPFVWVNFLEPDLDDLYRQAMVSFLSDLDALEADESPPSSKLRKASEVL